MVIRDSLVLFIAAEPNSSSGEKLFGFISQSINQTAPLFNAILEEQNICSVVWCQKLSETITEIIGILRLGQIHRWDSFTDTRDEFSSMYLLADLIMRRIIKVVEDLIKSPAI